MLEVGTDLRTYGRGGERLVHTYIEEHGSAEFCVVCKKERHTPARLSWFPLRAYAATASGWMCPSWVKRVYWS